MSAFASDEERIASARAHLEHRSRRAVIPVIPASRVVHEPVEQKKVRIYFIEGAGKIKVGFSGDEGSRMSDIQSMSPVKLRLLSVIDGVTIDERRIHSALWEYRSHGEWFDLDFDTLVRVLDETEWELAEMVVAGKLEARDQATYLPLEEVEG